MIDSLFRWLKDEQALSGGLSVLGNGSLVLRGYQADQGVYQCSITLPGTGTLLSRVAKVVYKGKYFRYLEKIVGVIYSIGQHFDLQTDIVLLCILDAES